jgi:hypothetical protein
MKMEGLRFVPFSVAIWGFVTFAFALAFASAPRVERGSPTPRAAPSRPRPAAIEAAREAPSLVTRAARRGAGEYDPKVRFAIRRRPRRDAVRRKPAGDAVLRYRPFRATRGKDVEA